MKLKVLLLIQVIICCSMAANIDFTGKYIRDTRGNYVNDDTGKYITDIRGNYVNNDAGKYSIDIRGIYVSDSKGRYVPDSRGLYKFIPVPIAILLKPNTVPSDTPIPFEVRTNSPPKMISQPPLEVLPPRISPDTEDGKPVDYDSDA